MKWPIMMLNEMNAASTYNDAFQSYAGVVKKAAWSKANKGAWQIVSNYLSQKMGIS